MQSDLAVARLLIRRVMQEMAMNPDVILTWVQIVATLITAVAVLIGGLWAYTKFVVERGLLPPVEFSIECNALGKQGQKQLIEILLHLKNIGSSTLVAKDIQTRVRYIDCNDAIEVFTDSSETAFGRAKFPRLHTKELGAEKEKAPSTISVIGYDTFVQPGVDQIYTVVTAVPEAVTFVLIWARFHYAKRPSAMQLRMIKLSRRMGLIHYSLDHVREPHTIERAFHLGSRSE